VDDLASHAGKVVKCWQPLDSTWLYGRLYPHSSEMPHLGVGYMLYFRSYRGTGSRFISKLDFEQGCVYEWVTVKETRGKDIPTLAEVLAKGGRF
jgi:hypothetical protein